MASSASPSTVLSEGQVKAIAVLPSITAPLSIVGSALIIFMLFKRKDDRRATYRRILLGLSVCDILHSSWFMLGPLPVPKETGAIMAKGNQATCSATGFFNAFSVGSLFYNASLLLYFLLTIRYKISDQYLASKIEPILHILCLSFPLVAGTIGLILGVFNPVPTGLQYHCFIAPYPHNCLDDPEVECIRGGRSAMVFRWVAFVLPFVLANLFLYVALVIIYRTVRQSEQQSQRLFPHSNVQTSSYEVGVQSLLYAACFVLTYLLLLVYVVLGSLPKETAAKYYPLYVLVLIFFPLQGFFNFGITLRPRYSRLRKLRSEQSTFWVLKESIFGVSTVSQSLYHRRVQEASRRNLLPDPTVSRGGSNAAVVPEDTNS